MSVKTRHLAVDWLPMGGACPCGGGSPGAAPLASRSWAWLLLSASASSQSVCAAARAAHRLTRAPRARNPQASMREVTSCASWSRMQCYGSQLHRRMALTCMTWMTAEDVLDCTDKGGICSDSAQPVIALERQAALSQPGKPLQSMVQAGAFTRS